MNVREHNMCSKYILCPILICFSSNLWFVWTIPFCSYMTNPHIFYLRVAAMVQRYYSQPNERVLMGINLQMDPTTNSGLKIQHNQHCWTLEPPQSKKIKMPMHMSR